MRAAPRRQLGVHSSPKSSAVKHLHSTECIVSSLHYVSGGGFGAYPFALNGNRRVERGELAFFSKQGVWEAEIPMAVPSIANQHPTHWERSRRTRRQRGVVLVTLRSSPIFVGPMPGSYEITLVRVSKRALDPDNAVAAFKAIQDGVADWLHMQDGDRRLVWRYAQLKTPLPKYQAVLIQVVKADVAEAWRRELHGGGR